MTNALVSAAPIHNVESISATLDASVAESTLRAYKIAQAAFVAYCDERNWDLYPASADDSGEYIGHVLSWLQSMADDGKTVSTVNKSLAGIKFFASRESQLAFMIVTSSREIKALMAGLSRINKATPIRQAQALTLNDLKRVHKSLQRRTARNLRNRALIALGVATALRSQSLADLNLGDISTSSTVDGLNVRVRFSKTDQVGHGRTITVLRSSKKSLDPVAAVQQWIDYLSSVGITDPAAPLFVHVRGTSVQAERISNASDAITHIVRGVLIAAGVVDEPGSLAYSSHSLRATFITLSQQAGVSEANVANISGHKNLNILRGYDRTTSEQHAQTAYLGD